MERIYSTGNRTTDRLVQLRITGNVIPQIWYKTIRKGTGKPNLNAIIILADIVYWYRPVEIRDEGSGALIGYRKRFKGDLLQRSYQQIADQFGISKRDATNAVVELEKLGVVKRVFRTLTAEGISIPNVLFLSLDADVLERITYPSEFEDAAVDSRTDGDISEQAKVIFGNSEMDAVREEDEPAACKNWEAQADGSEDDENRGRENTVSSLEAMQADCGYRLPQMSGRYLQNAPYMSQKQGRGITQIGDTPPPKGGRCPTGLGDYTENTYKDYNRDHLLSSYQQSVEAFQEQIGYGQLCEEYFGDRRLDEVVAVAVEVLTSPAETIRVNREDRPAQLVKAQFAKLTGEHVEYVLERLEQSEKPITNVRAVLITALYNAVNTLSCYAGNLYRYHTAQGKFEGGMKD